jgi:hypothetical protein
MDAATRRLLNSILSYIDDAPPNVSLDMIKELKGISEQIMDAAVANSPVTPGQMAVAHAIGKDEPEPVKIEEDIDKSPGQKEAEGIGS